MTPLGIKRHWRSLRIKGRPTKMPNVREGRQIICRVRFHGGKQRELAIVCNSLEQMQALYDQHANKAIISWHHTGVFVVPLRAT
jgi:uncharacterized membrane protein